MLRATADEHELVLDETQLASVVDATLAEVFRCWIWSRDLISICSRFLGFQGRESASHSTPPSFSTTQ